MSLVTLVINAKYLSVRNAHYLIKLMFQVKLLHFISLSTNCTHVILKLAVMNLILAFSKFFCKQHLNFLNARKLAKLNVFGLAHNTNFHFVKNVFIQTRL